MTEESIEDMRQQVALLHEENNKARKVIMNADKYRKILGIHTERQKVDEERDKLHRSILTLSSKYTQFTHKLDKQLHSLKSDDKARWEQFWNKCKNELKIV
jgi:phage shock protein A